MFGLNIWDIFAFIGFMFLVMFFYAGRNFVWTAFSIGLVAAFIVCGIFFLKGDAWPWDLFKKIVIAITYLGIIAELSNRIGNFVKRR